MASTVCGSSGFLVVATLAMLLSGCDDSGGDAAAGSARSISSSNISVDDRNVSNTGTSNTSASNTGTSNTGAGSIGTSDTSIGSNSVSGVVTPAPTPPVATSGAVSSPPAVSPSHSTLSISGSPGLAVNVGSAYSFTPTVTDTAGAVLAFTVLNKPVWATFDASTGKLSGSPVVADVGANSAVQIAVSDGVTSATLATFSIAVNPTPTDSVTVSWTAPAADTAGAPETDLAGYRVYYGTSATDMTTVITVNGAGDRDQVVSNLQPGTWYFAVKSYNAANVESELSGVVVVTI